jgi:hypothetical protein
MGLNDDWSFAFIARGVAQTGHIHYDGWAAPILGVQAWWGGVLIAVFGFSFTLLRLSTLPFAAGCTLLVYGLGRRTGLTASLAAFGALALTLSPVFTTLATSFMSDVPALFFWLACFYGATRAAGAPGFARPALWLTAAATAGFAGGTIRQIVWVSPLLAIAAVGWLRREDRRLLAVAAALWCGLAAAAATCLRWYQSQPGHQPLPAPSVRDILSGIAEPIRLMTLACLVAILPALLLYTTGWRRWLRAPIAPVVAILSAVAFVAACIFWFEDDLLLGNLVTVYGMLWENSEALGVKPLLFGTVALAILGAAVCLGAGLAGAWLFDSWRSRTVALDVPIRRLLLLTAPSCGIYLMAVAFRYASDGIVFDRYLIFVTPPILIGLLWLYQSQIRTSPSPLGWTVLALFAIFGVCTTHDYIASARARLQAASRVIAAGVPRTRVSAGLEFDGWTQLEQTGQIPPLAERKRNTRVFPIEDPYWFWRMTPAIEPQYFMVYSPIEGLRNSSFPPIDYRVWLPPFHRRVLTQRLP